MQNSESPPFNLIMYPLIILVLGIIMTVGVIWESDEIQKIHQEQSRAAANADISSPPPTNRKTHAVIHMGIHKTGSTTIQVRSEKLKEQLKKDGYEMPWVLFENLWGAEYSKIQKKRKLVIWSNQVRFATCFRLPNEKERQKYPCESDLLLAGLEIAERKSNIFITSEVFDRLESTGIKLLSQYLSHWDDTTIIVYYRRYYDWLGSLFNEGAKKRSLKQVEKWEQNVVDFITNNTSHVPDMYTFPLVQRLEKEFDNVVLMNMHDKSKDFFCDAMPYAHHTCKAIRESADKEKVLNSSVDFIYQDLAYGAFKKGLVAIKTDSKMNEVAKAVKLFQERKLGLRSSDFIMTCPSSETKKILLEKSLEFEKSLFPEWFSSPLGEAKLRSDFEKKARSPILCAVDADAVLGEKVWQDFFETLE